MHAPGVAWRRGASSLPAILAADWFRCAGVAGGRPDVVEPAVLAGLAGAVARGPTSMSSAARIAAAWAAATWAANPATVGAAKSPATGSRTPNSPASAPTTRAACSEVPPMSKNRSSRPMVSRASAWRQPRATCSSQAPRGATYGVTRSGRVATGSDGASSAARSSLPCAVRGRVSTQDQRLGIIAPAPARAAARRARGGRSGRDPAAPLRSPRRGWPRPRWPRSGRSR